MKTVSTALAALLATGNFVRADLWTITLNGGLVVRWTSHDQPIQFGGNTFLKGPAIDRGAISEKVGVEVATIDLAITAVASDLINGTAIIPFIAKHGLDGASVKLERVFAVNWAAPMVGSAIRFAGKVTSINSIQGAMAHLTVSSWLVLLNASAPRNLFQAGCLHTLYDTGCTISPGSYSTAGTVAGSGGAQAFGSGLTPVLNYYAQGRVLFTSGANSGISRTVKSNDASGNFTLVTPLPAACAIGDTFTAYAGCDLSMATCSAKFSNLQHFKGFPFVPLPTTALGSAAPTTTSGGKG
jgi:uncharacterized phage protein (TIGR02218 family)